MTDAMTWTHTVRDEESRFVIMQMPDESVWYWLNLPLGVHLLTQTASVVTLGGIPGIRLPL